MQVTGYKARSIQGKWHAVVYWKDDEGKRHQKSKVLEAKDEAEAHEKAMEYYILCKTGQIPLVREKKQPLDLYEYAEAYFKGRLDRHEYERSTYSTNLKHLRAWKRALGEKVPFKSPIISEKKVQSVISQWFADGRDATTVDKRITCLNEVFKAAIHDNLCSSNPFDHVKRPKKGWKALNGCADADMRGSIAETLMNLPLDSLKVAFNLAFWTGMRRGEVAGLQWCNIDLERRVIWVRNAIGADDAGKYVKPPKSNRPRDIVIPTPLLDLLYEWKDTVSTPISPQTYVVCDSDGMYLNPDYITHQFTALARFMGWEGAAGRRMTLHDLRHTVATALISDGADVKTVQSVMGHSSAAITLDMYASADSRAKWDAALTLEHSIRRSAPKGAQSWAGTQTERRCTGRMRTIAC